MWLPLWPKCHGTGRGAMVWRLRSPYRPFSMRPVLKYCCLSRKPAPIIIILLPARLLARMRNEYCHSFAVREANFGAGAPVTGEGGVRASPLLRRETIVSHINREKKNRIVARMLWHKRRIKARAAGVTPTYNKCGLCKEWPFLR